jgi:dihydroxy-acid dehydratase
MSGTAAGTVVLHVAPEAAVGGPLSLVESGDEIELDVMNRSLNVRVSSETLLRRGARRQAAPEASGGGYVQLYRRHVLQSDQGADFDFLLGCRGAAPPTGAH